MTVQWAWEADPGPARIDPRLLARVESAVRRVVDDRQDAYINWLAGSLRFPTVSGCSDREGQQAYRDAMDACIRYVRIEAERLGMAWREHDGMACVAEWKGRSGERSLGIATHLDVVPAEGVWQHPPFGGTVVDGEVWGRGAQDDKGPAAAAMAAVDVLRRIGLEPAQDVRLLFGTLEETDDWPDIDLLLEREEPPHVTLVPDGAFPVIVGEKGIITVQWHAEWPEQATAGPRFLALHGGERHNVVPAEARVWLTCGDTADAAEAALERMGAEEVAATHTPPASARGAACLEGVYHGRAAHGAFPADGDNAALKALGGIRDHFGDDGPGRFAGFLLQHCSALDGAGLDLDRSHTRMGDATLNLGIVEMGTTHGHAHINVRFPIGLTVRDVRRRFEQAAADADGLRVTCTTQGRPQDPIFVSPEDHPRLVHALQAAYHTATGREPKLATMAGTTYAKVFPLAMAFGPQDDATGEPILAHQCDERVSVKRFLENIRIYALAIALLAFDEDDLEAVTVVGRPSRGPAPGTQGGRRPRRERPG